MSRSVTEWVGKTHDAKVPARVQLRIWRRQTDDGKKNFAICVLSGLPLRWTDKKHLHHLLALCNGGEHRESNLFFVHDQANRDEAKIEVAIRAGNDARAKKHAGIKDGKTGLEGRDRATLHRAKARRSHERSGGKIGVPGHRPLYEDAR